MRSIVLFAALLGSALFCSFGCVDPNLLPTDDDDTIATSGDVTVTLELDREVEDVEFEIDGHPSEATTTLEEGGPYALEAEVPGINPINLPWARPPCDLTVAHGKVEVVTYNNPTWASTFAQPETTESTVRDGGTLTVPTVDAPYNGHAYDCLIGASHDTVILQTQDGQEIQGWLGPVVFNRELMADYGDQGRFDGEFSEDYAQIDGVITYDLGDHLNVHCDQL